LYVRELRRKCECVRDGEKSVDGTSQRNGNKLFNKSNQNPGGVRFSPGSGQRDREGARSQNETKPTTHKILIQEGSARPPERQLNHGKLEIQEVGGYFGRREE
jgi:hypothetical protein